MTAMTATCIPPGAAHAPVRKLSDRRRFRPGALPDVVVAGLNGDGTFLLRRTEAARRPDVPRRVSVHTDTRPARWPATAPAGA
jgi:hypothetical protein